MYLRVLLLATIAGKVVAVKIFHRQFMGMQLPIGNPYFEGGRQGVKRRRVEAGVEQRIKSPLTWGMIPEMQYGAS